MDVSAQPALEDQTLDFSDVEQLLGSINAVPGAPLPCGRRSRRPESLGLEGDAGMARKVVKV